MKRLLTVGLFVNAFILGGWVFQPAPFGAAGEAPSVENGDVNGDGARDISDATFLLNWLFLGGPRPVALAGGGLTSEQAEILSHLSLVDAQDGSGGTVKTLVVDGLNVQIVNGMGATSETNGAGNLIIGYHELRTVGDRRGGSHNLIVGERHNYTRYGGIVAGFQNTISGDFSSVTGGSDNVASGVGATVSGGHPNVASELYSHVCGGSNNVASGIHSVVLGGSNNSATAESTTVCGGGGFDGTFDGNEANGPFSLVAGGQGNRANGEASVIVAGSHNIAAGTHSSVLGGGGFDFETEIASGNHAAGAYSTIVAGSHNVTGDPETPGDARGERKPGYGAVISGGTQNTASGTWATVSGGAEQSAALENDHVP